MGVGVLLVAQGGDHLAGQPFIELLAFGVAEADQRLVEAGFAHRIDRLFSAAAAVVQADAAGLVGLEAAVQGLWMMQAEQAGEVVGGEPGLVVDHHAAQGAVMAEEGGGDVCVMHRGAPVVG